MRDLVSGEEKVEILLDVHSLVHAEPIGHVANALADRSGLRDRVVAHDA